MSMKLARQAARQGRGCGLDRNIHGEFTMGFYLRGKGAGVRYGQVVRPTREAVREAAREAGFVEVVDRT